MGAAINPLDNPHERYDNVDGTVPVDLLQKAAQVEIGLSPGDGKIDLPGVWKAIRTLADFVTSF